MNKEKKEVDFQLTKELPYSEAGKHETTATIIMHAPSMETLAESQNLGQLVMRAMGDAQKRAEVSQVSEEDIEKAKAKAEEEGLSASEIKMMLMSSESVSFMSVIGEFKRLAVKVCYVSTEEKMKHTLFDKMELDDFTRMVCFYIANFITPSLLSE